MTDEELLQQALEALEIGYASVKAEADQYHVAMAGYRPQHHAQMDADVQSVAKAITALRAALAEPEQEPVAYKHEWFRTGAMEPGEMRCIHCGMWNRESEPTPPARQWQGLTDEEIGNAANSVRWSQQYHVDFARAIEAALREKNT